MLGLRHAVETAKRELRIARLPGVTESASYSDVFAMTEAFAPRFFPIANRILALAGKTVVYLLQFTQYNAQRIIPLLQDFSGHQEQRAKELLFSEFVDQNEEIEFDSDEDRRRNGKLELQFELDLSKTPELRLLVLNEPEAAFRDLYFLARATTTKLFCVQIGACACALQPAFYLLARQTGLARLHLNGVDLVQSFYAFLQYLQLLERNKQVLEVLDISRSRLEVENLSFIHYIPAGEFVANGIAFLENDTYNGVSAERIMQQFADEARRNGGKLTPAQINCLLAPHLDLPQLETLRDAWKSAALRLVRRSPCVRQVQCDGSVLLQLLCRICIENERLPQNAYKLLFQRAYEQDFPQTDGTAQRRPENVQPTLALTATPVRTAHSCETGTIQRKLKAFLDFESACWQTGDKPAPIATVLRESFPEKEAITIKAAGHNRRGQSAVCDRLSQPRQPQLAHWQVELRGEQQKASKRRAQPRK